MKRIYFTIKRYFLKKMIFKTILLINQSDAGCDKRWKFEACLRYIFQEHQWMITDNSIIFTNPIKIYPNIYRSKETECDSIVYIPFGEEIRMCFPNGNDTPFFSLADSEEGYVMIEILLDILNQSYKY